MSLVFDHASLVASGASPDGNDLRVLHYDTDSKTYTQIDRVLESDSGWGRIDTKIWFRTQILITRLTVDGVAHWLQWGGDDLTPPRADPARIFDYFDDFDTARYSLSTQGTPDVMVAGGNLVVTANANSSTYQSATMRFFGVDFQYRGIIVESRTKVTNPQIKFLCGGAPVVQLEDTSASWIRAAMDVFDGRHHHTRWVTDRLQGTPGGATANAGWHIYGLNWINDDVVLTRDAIDLFSGKSPSEWATPDHGKLRPVLNLQGGGASCAGSGEVGLEMDWLRVRRTGTEHPVASFPDPY